MFPSHLLDELARVFARVALERLIREARAGAIEAAEDMYRPPSSEESIESSTPPLTHTEQRP